MLNKLQRIDLQLRHLLNLLEKDKHDPELRMQIDTLLQEKNDLEELPNNE